jgi:hypothetical protein
MRAVTGVILVARINRSSRQTIRRVQRVISTAHGTIVGVVATGVTGGTGYEGYSPKHYTNGTGKRPRWLRKGSADKAAKVTESDQVEDSDRVEHDAAEVNGSGDPEGRQESEPSPADHEQKSV